MHSVNRRRFLRGSCVALALPAFASLKPQLAEAAEAVGMTTASGSPLRMAFMSIPNGVQQDKWFPSGSGKDFKLNRTMEALEPLRDQLQVIAGLDHENATAGNDGAGDHARASATFLTGARARKTAGKDIHVGISIDQLAAQKFGHMTRYPSLELSCDAIRNSGGCDSGYACAYQYNLAWSSPTTPVTPEPNPRLVFERLYGTGQPGQRQRNLQLRQQSNRSVLDFVMEDAGDLKRQLGQGDVRKLDEYIDGVRTLEKNIQAAERFGTSPDPALATPAGIPPEFEQHIDLMFDLLALAFQTDTTRIGTLLIAYDGSNRTFPNLGIGEGHHYLTHNQREAELAEKVAKIDQFYVARLARFLKKLSETNDVDGRSVLHNSLIVYGGAIADGNRHTHANLPVILAGSAGGAIGTGRYLDAGSVPMANLFVEMLNIAGVSVDKFGDSSGRLSLS